MLQTRIPVSVSKILQAKTKIPLNQEDLKFFLSSCSIEEKDEVFRVVLKGTMDKPNRKLAQDVLEEVTDFKDDEINFFKNHVNKNELSLNTGGFKWFIDKSSNNWLLSKNTVPHDILKKMNLDLSNADANIKSAFYNKIRGLNEEEYKIFLDEHIYNASDKIKSHFINILFGFGNLKNIDELKMLYPSNIPNDLKGDIGFTLLFRKNINLLSQYKNCVVEAINRHEGRDLNQKGLGKVIDGKTLAFIYSVYDDLDVDSRQNFLKTLINDVFVYKEQGYQKEVMNTLLNINQKNPTKVPKEIFIVMLWRIIHSSSKAQKDLFVSNIMSHAKKQGFYNEIKDTMIYNPNNLEIKINGSRLNISNATVKEYFQKFLYLTLQEELKAKPEVGKKMKI